MKTNLLLPSWMTSLDLYTHHGNLTTSIGKLTNEDCSADCNVGFSLGALALLKDIDRVQGKVVLVNPPLPKRNAFAWFVRWVAYIATEGLFLKRQHFTKNPFRYCAEIVTNVRLLGSDFSATLARFPKDKLTVIRGKKDTFFCGSEAVNFLRSLGVEVIEVDAGHTGQRMPKML